MSKFPQSHLLLQWSLKKAEMVLKDRINSSLRSSFFAGYIWLQAYSLRLKQEYSKTMPSYSLTQLCSTVTNFALTGNVPALTSFTKLQNELLDGEELVRLWKTWSKMKQSALTREHLIQTP